ncbi:nucleotidyltransferase family protein [Novosphingobium ginsenosidimutans]|uniref:nucleotidyltransferase family protein n=1 Tax=Novosphingobium ginsenosidimutans TaxID=1176536 RepID=UPI001375B3A2|nr:NTP transferase domain-containing protein [Novosphingobium ginsenosidimutans]
MAEPRLAVAVLAAGQSRRFGPQDKLAAPFGEALLGEQAARTLGGLAFAHRWVIAARGDHPCAPGWAAAGFDIAVNDRAASGMGSSLALAAQLAQAAGADALLVALADMPLVPAGHFAALLARAVALGPGAIVASEADGQRSPPAVFGSSHLPALAKAAGDQGARALLGRAEPLVCAADWLADVDDPAALARVRALVTRGESC